ncbi:hypothetical protein KKC13_07120 [bacterium]|nr:hypothetical protein [bacterium]MBU1956908.1 hypothetical protein [bacterium]
MGLKSWMFVLWMSVGVMFNGCGTEVSSCSEGEIVLADGSCGLEQSVLDSDESNTGTSLAVLNTDQVAEDKRESESQTEEVTRVNNVSTTTNETNTNPTDENSDNSTETLTTSTQSVETNTDTQEENSATTVNYKTLPQSMSENLNVGFGGRNAYPFAKEGSDSAIWVNSVTLMLNEHIAENAYYQTIRNFDGDKFKTLQQYLVKSKYISYWITEGWEESWYTPSKIQEAMDAGYIPVFIYWYFGDKLTSVPSGETLSNYYEDNQKVANFLNQLNGTKLFIMEPEFNKDAILENNSTQTAFATIISTAIDTIESNSSDIYFSLCMTDRGSRGATSTLPSCGYDNCALGDKHSWSETELIYKTLDEKLSFISFQEMVAQFSRDPSNPGSWNEPNPIAYTKDETGVDYLAQRIVNFSAYLNESHNKPVFLPYLSIATATWNDSDSTGTVSDGEIDKEGWINIPEQVYGALANEREALKNSGLFGYMPMALFDNPRQDYGGYQYFMQNEYHLGLIQSSAEDETDKYIYGDLAYKGDVLEQIFGAL